MQYTYRPAQQQNWIWATIPGRLQYNGSTRVSEAGCGPVLCEPLRGPARLTSAGPRNRPTKTGSPSSGWRSGGFSRDICILTVASAAVEERLSIWYSVNVDFRGWHCEPLTGFSGGTQKKMKPKNCHCEGAAGDCGNLLPFVTREPFIFLGAGPRPTRQLVPWASSNRSNTGDCHGPRRPRNDTYSFNLDRVLVFLSIRTTDKSYQNPRQIPRGQTNVV